MKTDTIVLLPCYERFGTVKKILSIYVKSNYDVLAFTQAYTAAQIAQLKRICPTAIFVNYDKAMGIGYIRKSMFMYLFEVIKSSYDYVFMHDNDIIVNLADIDILKDYLKDSQYNIASIDVSNILADSTLHCTESDVLSGAMLMKYKSLKNVWSKTTIMNNCEDIELINLLGNIGILVNMKYLQTKLDMSKSTMSTWLSAQKTSLKYLSEKYGEDNLDVFDSSNDRKIIKFKTNKKSKLIIFEGVDKSGKSTTLTEINKATNYAHWLTDRGPISYLAYDEYFGRNIVNKTSMIEFIKRNADDILIIYFYASDKVLKQRYKKHNHEDVDIQGHKKIFEKYINDLSKTNKVCSIDTSKTSIREVTNKVLNFIQQNEK